MFDIESVVAEFEPVGAQRNRTYEEPLKNGGHRS